MSDWVRLCALAEAPADGNVSEASAGDVAICLARINGELAALDNWCPHRRGPLGQGWVEGNAVVCPWHSWTFDVGTGAAEYPENESVKVYRVKVQDEDVLIQLGTEGGAENGSRATCGFLEGAQDLG